MIEYINCLSEPAASFLGALIGVLGGLIAILLGALLNAHLNRKRDDRIANQLIQNTALAFKVELEKFHRLFHDGISELQNSPTDHFLIPDPTNLIQIYPESVKEIRLLNSNTIESIINSYGLVNEYSERLFLLGADVKQLPSGKHACLLPSEHRQGVAEINGMFCEEIQKTINLLKQDIEHMEMKLK